MRTRKYHPRRKLILKIIGVVESIVDTTWQFGSSGLHRQGHRYELALECGAIAHINRKSHSSRYIQHECLQCDFEDRAKNCKKWERIA
jgi:hypothetical protein